MSCGRIFITKDALLHHLNKDHNPEDAQYMYVICYNENELICTAWLLWALLSHWLLDTRGHKVCYLSPFIFSFLWFLNYSTVWLNEWTWFGITMPTCACFPWKLGTISCCLAVLEDHTHSRQIVQNWIDNGKWIQLLSVFAAFLLGNRFARALAYALWAACADAGLRVAGLRSRLPAALQITRTYSCAYRRQALSVSISCELWICIMVICIMYEVFQ